jgi:hypothetical protein
MTREQATERVGQMELTELIEIWNDHAVEQREDLLQVRTMDDFMWWEHVKRELDMHNFIFFLCRSSEEHLFEYHDEYFFCDVEEDRIYSFTTAEQFLEIVSKNFFIYLFAGE